MSRGEVEAPYVQARLLAVGSFVIASAQLASSQRSNGRPSLCVDVLQVMDLSGAPSSSSRLFAPGLGRVVVSTLCVRDNLIAAGGFNGDLVIRNTNQQDPVCR